MVFHCIPWRFYLGPITQTVKQTGYNLIYDVGGKKGGSKQKNPMNLKK